MVGLDTTVIVEGRDLVSLKLLEASVVVQVLTWQLQTQLLDCTDVLYCLAHVLSFAQCSVSL